ncbi:hypothetical protein B0A50_02088 [Salinomyces thailandicus]|uniref:Metallo-beta-lactamase domain-containing protein n=1 Tax=Salinomyces thailandicus TaxID=706561 RepID=A0A4V5N607_9PEZI|nr:hypothetical protein B0A50_02088 [Salinomyces thailandica]
MTSAVSINRLPPLSIPGETKAHHRPNGGYRNPWESYREVGASEAFKLRFGSHPEKNFVPVPQGPNGTRSDELVKVRKPDWGLQQKGKLRATWIGHASFLIELPAQAGAERGVRILCDPVFSERTSPSQWFGPKRYTPTPCSLDELPDVDVVCISHNHYDHLDYTAVQHIYNKRGKNVHFLAALGNKKWFTQHVGCEEDQATELDWWDGCELDVKTYGKVRLTCCPTQHGSGRFINDQGHTLWCSWAIEGNGKRLFFAGDTAYQAQGTPSPCPAFKHVGKALGPFDLALLPIGLMSPHSWMGSVHATPEQSLQIHKEVKSKLSIGIHWGTVRGGISAHYEDVRDPPRRWHAAAEKESLWRGGGPEGTPLDSAGEGVGLCEIGETVTV